MRRNTIARFTLMLTTNTSSFAQTESSQHMGMMNPSAAYPPLQGRPLCHRTKTLSLGPLHDPNEVEILLQPFTLRQSPVCVREWLPNGRTVGDDLASVHPPDTYVRT